MTSQTTSQIEEAERLTLQILLHLFQDRMPENVGVRLWNGKKWPDDSPKAATIVLNHLGLPVSQDAASSRAKHA